MLLLLALGEHALHQLDDLLHGGHGRPRRMFYVLCVFVVVLCICMLYMYMFYIWVTDDLGGFSEAA